jgi:hypothetical protein
MPSIWPDLRRAACDKAKVEQMRGIIEYDEGPLSALFEIAEIDPESREAFGTCASDERFTRPSALISDASVLNQPSQP